MSEQSTVERRECGHPASDGSGRVCRRICAPGRDYHAGGHWYAAPDLDGASVREATARWIVTGEQPQADAFAVCSECEERHHADWDCRTYRPVCGECGHRGTRRFRQREQGGPFLDVLAPSLAAVHLECARCDGTDIGLEVVNA